MKNQFLRVQELKISDYVIDVINVKGINLYNNINQIGYVLELVINDVTDIKNKLPIKGGEILKFIAFDQDKNKFKKEFVCTNIEEVNKQNEYNVITKLTFISRDAYYLSVNRDYNHYNDTISNIVNKYTTSDLVDNNPTSAKYSVIIPGFSKTKAIKYMIDNFTKSHLYFENKDNFVLSDVNDLLVKGENTYVQTNDNALYKYAIIGYKEIQVFNAMEESYNNIYNNNYIAYNPNTKTIDGINVTINDLQDEETRLGIGDNYSTIIQDSIQIKNTVVPYSTNVLNNSVDTFGLFNKRYEMLLHGDFNLEVGKTIEVRYKDRFNNNLNPLLNGTYLISKTAHYMDSKEFVTKVEVVKNSYFKK